MRIQAVAGHAVVGRVDGKLREVGSGQLVEKTHVLELRPTQHAGIRRRPTRASAASARAARGAVRAPNPPRPHTACTTLPPSPKVQTAAPRAPRRRPRRHPRPAPRRGAPGTLITIPPKDAAPAPPLLPRAPPACSTLRKDAHGSPFRLRYFGRGHLFSTYAPGTSNPQNSATREHRGTGAPVLLHGARARARTRAPDTYAVRCCGSKGLLGACARHSRPNATS